MLLGKKSRPSEALKLNSVTIKESTRGSLIGTIDNYLMIAYILILQQPLSNKKLKISCFT